VVSDENSSLTTTNKGRGRELIPALVPCLLCTHRLKASPRRVSDQPAIEKAWPELLLAYSACGPPSSTIGLASLRCPTRPAFPQRVSGQPASGPISLATWLWYSAYPTSSELGLRSRSNAPAAIRRRYVHDATNSREGQVFPRVVHMPTLW